MIIGLVIILGIGFAGFAGFHIWKYQNLKRENAQLVERNVVYESANVTSQNTITSLMFQASLTAMTRDKLELEKRENAQVRNELERKLQKHDLNFLFKSKPGLVINRMERATNKVFSDLEELSR